jgi:hypothetical protein
MKKMCEQDYDENEDLYLKSIMEQKMREKKRLIFLYKHLHKEIRESYGRDDETFDDMAFLEFAEDSIEKNWVSIQYLIKEMQIINEGKKNEVEKNDMC